MPVWAPADVGMGGGVAYWAHAGGFVFGAVLGYLLGLFNNDQGSDLPAGTAKEPLGETLSD